MRDTNREIKCHCCLKDANMKKVTEVMLRSVSLREKEIQSKN